MTGRSRARSLGLPTGERPAWPGLRSRPVERAAQVPPALSVVSANRVTGGIRVRYPGGRAGHAASVAAMPTADVLALTTAMLGAGRPGPASALYALAVLAVLAITGLHRLRICLRAADQAGRVVAAVAVPLLALLLLMSVLPSLGHAAPWRWAAAMARQAAWSAVLLVAFRVAACAALRAAHRRGLLTETCLLVGAGTFAAYLAELARQHPELGLRVAGYVDDGPPRRDLALPSLGGPASLPEVAARFDISRVIVCYAACKDEDLVTVLRSSQLRRADVCVVPRFYELGAAVPRSCLDEIWGIPLIPLRLAGRRHAALAAKRAFDLVGAAILLAVASPALLAAAAAIRLQSGRRVMFRQTRVTGPGRTAQILKLRTLSDHSNPDTSWTAPTRLCTPFGRWLRSTHVDELPQLMNVLRGDMSLVGPRPERPYFAERFGREILRYDDRTRMRAGLTGWAQVHGLNGDTSIVERARFDNQYIEYWSPWLDVVIMARTVMGALHGLLGVRR
jgi:exopolysaccharide biosynthesis polyprenyl glycosylphosphotransferase